MTLTTLIVLNAILAAALVYGLVWFLGLGIHHDRRIRLERVRAPRPAPRAERDRLAA